MTTTTPLSLAPCGLNQPGIRREESETPHGDDWTHLCTVADQRVDPLDVYGITPAGPAAYFGWGDIPDQYGRRYLGDTKDDDPVPPDPKLTDLPPLRPWWGPQSRT